MKVESIVFEGAQIPCVQDENGEIYFAVKPICVALGVDNRKQRDAIKADEVLGQLVTTWSLVAADGRNREMDCLPLEQLTGWLFQINTKLVKPESREKLLKFKRECYKVLHNHFFGGTQKEVPASEAHKAMAHIQNCQRLQWELAERMEKRRILDKQIYRLQKLLTDYNYNANPMKQLGLFIDSRAEGEINPLLQKV